MNENTTIEVGILNKNDIQAMRTADSVCFDHGNGIQFSGIRCNKRTPRDTWEKEKVIHIACQSSVHDHQKDDVPSWERKFTCFAMIFGSKHSDEWQTLCHFLRVGDKVSLRWVGANNNGYIDRATVTERDESINNAGLGEKLYHDELYLQIERKGRRFSFFVCDSICPSNSARMVKRA